MTDAAAGISRYMESLASGRHLFSGLKMSDVAVDGVDLAVELEVDDSLTGARGALQGGLVATLADMVGGRLAMAGVEPGGIVVTSDLTIHYLAPVMAGPAHATGTVLRRGGRTVVVRVDVYDGRDGPLAAACTLAFTVIRPR